MTEKREASRFPFVGRIMIFHESTGFIEAKTKNLSDTGVLLVCEPEKIPAVGSIVSGQVLDLPQGEGPKLKMEVVRVDPDGVGLRFLTE